MKKELKINLQTPVARYAPGVIWAEMETLEADTNENLQFIN
ncbi:MAG: hypothetical protein RL108_1230 [Bacteroidota bacterium]|jgi:hypothetical protein